MRGRGGGRMTRGGRGGSFGGNVGRGRGGNSGGGRAYDPLACYRCGVRGHLARGCPQSRQARSTGSNSTKNAPSFKSGRGGPRRGRGRQVRFGGMGVVYDKEGNECPVDDEGQIYIPYSSRQTVAEEWFEKEKEKDIKN